jgi:hypothetical protein
MRLVVDPGAHSARVTVSITAPGVTEVTGPVVVRLAGVAREVTLRHGSATVRLTDLPPGKHTLTVRYAGSDTVNRLTATRTVRIG